jgi:hypothetical protein
MNALCALNSATKRPEAAHSSARGILARHNLMPQLWGMHACMHASTLLAFVGYHIALGRLSIAGGMGGNGVVG